MRKLLLTGVLTTALFALGCAAMHDVLFGLFSDAYSEGGTNYFEKRYHYDQQLEAWDNYEP